MPSSDELIDDRADTPVASYQALPVRRTAPVAVGVVAVAAVAWFLTVRQADSMSGMVMGLGQAGRRMPGAMGVGSFFVMWSVMMTAMMAPAIVPAVLAHRRVLLRRDEGAASSATLFAGFIAVWSLVGVAYLPPYLWFRDLGADAASSRWLPVVAGLILVGAGGYQFTRRKTHCQQTCCAPVALALDHDAGRGMTSAFRTGMAYGVHCLGCCWALMAVLLVVGLMNIGWMIGLTVLFVVEKHWRGATTVGRVAGVALIVLGVAVIASPDLLDTISGPSASASDMDMDDMDMG